MATGGGGLAWGVSADPSKVLEMLKRIQDGTGGARLAAALDEAMLFAQAAVLTAPTPIDTGALRGSIRPIRAGTYNRIVGTSIPYALPVETGSRPHEIRPKHGKFLSFQSRKTGKWTRKTVVRHPGTKGARMFEIGAERLEAKIGYFFAKHLALP